MKQALYKEKGEYMSYLIVAAHPDDEVLGAGATIYRLSQSGKEVNVCILSAQAMARANRPGDQELQDDMETPSSPTSIKVSGRKAFMAVFRDHSVAEGTSINSSSFSGVSSWERAA